MPDAREIGETIAVEVEVAIEHLTPFCSHATDDNHDLRMALYGLRTALAVWRAHFPEDPE